MYNYVRAVMYKYEYIREFRKSTKFHATAFIVLLSHHPRTLLMNDVEISKTIKKMEGREKKALMNH